MVASDEVIIVDESRDTILDSAFCDQSSTTASLTSSIMRYTYEHGRRYHTYQEGRYLIPNDEKEQEHMSIISHLFRLILGGRLFLAPIPEDVKHVLDIGTGTGDWAIEMADRYPKALVIGNDLSPIQPGLVPPNVQFEVDDVENDWAHSNPFDYIHCRFMASSIRDWPRLFRQVLENLAPNGYAEFYDFDFLFRSDDNSLLPTHEMYINCSETTSAAEKIGQTACPGPHLARWAREAGFVNITERKMKVPIGPWAKDPKLKEIGAWNQVQSMEGMEGWSMALLTRVNGWSEQRVREHLVRLKKDFLDTKIHAYMTAYVVYGQRPEKLEKN
ncbi:UMTA [Nannizzia gypsea CBS 118893]|uniref:UMTA n=1 Tax=Arthroderma gypseum (strain ATCC MYA-4604 / CBS 118893) TaxID=535722 RepID=E4UXN2_ARTGP|nr:UMTA [Nannizzia gypsea CBS 118893]EFR01927.1 UMTA [Nannizzia gypsea CBS 118893]